MRHTPYVRARSGSRFDRASTRLYLAALCIPMVVASGACAPSTGQGGAPDAQTEARLEAAAMPSRRAQIMFDWNMTDRDARFSGRGVLRLDTGYRARVDLFDTRGTTLAAAVVEEGIMRVAPENAAALLPPPALLWATLGVFRAPVDVPLTSTRTGADGTTLEYVRDRTQWRFRFQNDRLRSTEWTDGTGRRTVELSGTAELDMPAQAIFRDWTAFRELTLRVTEIEERAAFEPDVWKLPGER